MSDPCASKFWYHGNGCGLTLENMTDCGHCNWCIPIPKTESVPCQRYNAGRICGKTADPSLKICTTCLK